MPYDDNGARFHDLSDFGLGGNMDDAERRRLPRRHPPDSSNWLCQTEAPTGYAYKAYDEVADATSLNLFSASCIGAYCYVVAWNFDDDGTIRPEVGATGTLQRYGGTPQSSWPMGGGRRAVAHMHNFYWRLDFDVDGAANDRVEELEARFAPGTGRQQLNNTRQAFSAEVARRVAPGGFRSWRVRDTVTTNGDDHPISFELLPNPDNIFRGPSYEAFTQNELYVTRNRACERFASHNPTAGGCPSSLAGVRQRREPHGSGPGGLVRDLVPPPAPGRGRGAHAPALERVLDRPPGPHGDQPGRLTPAGSRPATAGPAGAGSRASYQQGHTSPTRGMAVWLTQVRGVSDPITARPAAGRPGGRRGPLPPGGWPCR